MKKGLLSILTVLAVVSAVNADPRFGVIGFTDAGAGVFITDDVYNGSLTVATSSNDAASKSETTSIGVNANYKIAADSVTAYTVGVGYKTISGEFSAVEIDTYTILDLNVGVERALSSNVVLTAETSLYRTTTLDISSTKTETTGLFSSARVGVAVLF